jgi:hypothetical protein
MHLMKIAQQLLDALRIDRPWHPGLIRGGEGRLPKRIKRPRNPASPPDAPQRIAASRTVRRLFKTLRIPLAKTAARADQEGGSR